MTNNIQSMVFALLPSMDTTAPIYVRVNDKRVRLSKLKKWKPFLKQTFVDENGKNKTVRLKLNCDTIDFGEQINKFGVPANEKFTNREREALEFINGTIIAKDKVVQDFLMSIPDYEGFKGRRAKGETPKYYLVDKGREAEEENVAFLNSLKAANKIASLNLKEAQDLLINIYGTHHTVPNDLVTAQNELVKFLNSTDSAVNEILKEDYTVDDEVNILLTRLMSAKVLSFDAIEGNAAKIKAGKWIALKEVGRDYPIDEKIRYFREFLTSKDGATLLADLKAELAKLSSTNAKTNKNSLTT